MVRCYAAPRDGQVVAEFRGESCRPSQKSLRFHSFPSVVDTLSHLMRAAPDGPADTSIRIIEVSEALGHDVVATAANCLMSHVLHSSRLAESPPSPAPERRQYFTAMNVLRADGDATNDFSAPALQHCQRQQRVSAPQDRVQLDLRHHRPGQHQCRRQWQHHNRSMQ